MPVTWPVWWDQLVPANRADRRKAARQQRRKGRS